MAVQFTGNLRLKYGKLPVTLVTYKNNQNNFLILCSSSDIFLQTNFDKIKLNCYENHSWGTLQLPDLRIGLNQLM